MANRAPFEATEAQLTLPCQPLTSSPGVWVTADATAAAVPPRVCMCLATCEPSQSRSGWRAETGTTDEADGATAECAARADGARVTPARAPPTAVTDTAARRNGTDIQNPHLA